MFRYYEATVTVGAGGQIEFVLPDAPQGARVHVAVREDPDAWAARLAAGTLIGPSLPDDVVRRESIYADDSA
jgi:hypothetical protein